MGIKRKRPGVDLCMPHAPVRHTAKHGHAITFLGICEGEDLDNIISAGNKKANKSRSGHAMREPDSHTAPTWLWPAFSTSTGMIMRQSYSDILHQRWPCPDQETRSLRC